MDRRNPFGWQHLEDDPGREQLAYKVADGTEVWDEDMAVYKKIVVTGSR